MAKQSVYGLAVSISDADAAVIAEKVQGTASVDQKMGNVAAGLLRDLARGGVMLPPDSAGRIDSAIHSTEPMAIVDAVEHSAGRKGEATRIEWIVDPTQIEYYRGLADNAGMSLEQQLKAILDHALMQGWLGAGAPDLRQVLLSHEQYRALQTLFAKDIVTGADIMQRLGSEQTAAEDDMILSSLSGN